MKPKREYPDPSPDRQGSFSQGEGGAFKGGHFNLRLPVFQVQMTLFYEKMTPLFGETPDSGSDWRELTPTVSRNGGLQHYYSEGSAGAQAGGCLKKGGRETGRVPDISICTSLDDSLSYITDRFIYISWIGDTYQW